MTRSEYCCFMLIVLLAGCLCLGGQQAAQSAAPEGTAKPAKADRLFKEQTKHTRHEITINGRSIAYTATVGTMMLKRDFEEPTAYIFYIAYTKDDVKDSGRRPVTFSFNGGPGSSSVWLHMGLLGPRRVRMAESGQAPPPPYSTEDNAYCLLDKTDLVFVDPVSTGFSRVMPGGDPKQFHGYKKDIHAVAQFIRRYVTRFERWGSPKFLIGESYGTTRAAGLCNYLQNAHGMNLNGVLLISAALAFQAFDPSPGNDLPYLLTLPSMTATAWFHNQLDDKLQADLGAAMEAAEAFALGDYARVLLMGDAAGAELVGRTAAGLARFTGLSKEYVLQANLRISVPRFAKELLREKRRTIGRLDSRLTGMDADAAGEGYEYDPAMAAVIPPYTACFNDYIRRELGWESDLAYEIFNFHVHPWDFSPFINRYVDVTPELREAMTKNQALKLFVASGYFDLGTPYLATRYAVNHLGLEPGLRDHVTIKHYRAGHMMYTDLESLRQLHGDIAAFMDAVLEENTKGVDHAN